MERFIRFAGAFPEPDLGLVLLAADCPSPVCAATGLADLEMLSGAFGSTGQDAAIRAFAEHSPRMTRISRES